ncbi:MAG: acetylornithine deacetylase (ArgE) [Lautropia sp. SCN 69-89]|nr:MAG: acetylornithine deacetylase (ArgE) [Lautropia sp. SCN 69-89]
MDIAAVIETLGRLVAFDTVSSRPNVALIDWAAERLQACGARTQVQHGDEPGKANLFATIGPEDRPGLMLSGHSDVVPVAGQAWSSDPFTLTGRDGRLYARGSADMKGFIACVLEAAPRFARAGLRMPVHVALSYNEETNMRGMRQLVSQMAAAPVRPAACIIGEPTSMQVVIANKGSAGYRVKVRGHSVHSSLRDQGVSAVECAAEIIVFANALQKRLNAAARHDGFEFPHTSVHVGRIEGGTAHNITAKDCEFLLEIRTLPGTRSADVLGEIRAHCDDVLLPAMRAISADSAIAFEEIFDTPALDERGNVYLAQAIMPLCGHVSAGRVSFGTEAGILQEIGVPTIVCGPGEIRVAHQPDEYVEVAQLEACSRFLDVLGERLARGELPLGR